MKNSLFIPGLTLILAILFSANNLSAQVWEDIEFNKGDFELNVGIGLMPSFVGKNTEAAIPPVSVSLGYRLKKTISVGAYLGYSKTRYVAPKDDEKNLDDDMPSLSNNYFLAGIRGEGHFNRGRFDFYGGGMIGYNFSIVESDNLAEDGRLENIQVDEYANLVTWSGHVGIKYLLTKQLGVFGEVGYGVSIVNLGITTRF